MAIRITTQYSPNAPVVAGDWPDGRPDNVSAPGLGDGLPFEQAQFRDVEGFKQYCLAQAGVAASGTSDNAVTSQWFQALEKLVSPRAVFDGFHTNNNGALQIDTINGGVAWDLSRDMIVRGTAVSFTKDLNAVWAEGPGLGGRGAVTLSDGWWYFFALGKSTERTAECEYGWSKDPLAADLLAAANGDGYTRAALIDAHLVELSAIQPYKRSLADPDYVRWVSPYVQVGISGSSSSARRTYTGIAPPNAILDYSIAVDIDNRTTRFVVTEIGDADVDPARYNYKEESDTNEWTSMRGRIAVDASSEFHIRKDGTVNSWNLVTNGWSAKRGSWVG
ncbi:MAG: hypothetical protein DRJ50_13930 [Actinobacteria bacterium]|nr:MAG: hypothetical protein DRJ50_13930 [Actinomycetota bacterium]